MNNNNTEHTRELYNTISSKLLEIYGEKPFSPDGGRLPKWNVSFPLEAEILNKDEGLINILKDKKYSILVPPLRIIDTLTNPESPHLNKERYIGLFEQILNMIIKCFGLNIMDITPLVKALVRLINNKLGFEYIILNCKEGLTSYTCGRAISTLLRNDGINKTKLVIFNTISDTDDNIDIGHYATLAPSEGPLNLEYGGDKNFYKNKYLMYGDDKNHSPGLNSYKSKYLKYKQKYLQLKNHIK